MKEYVEVTEKRFYFGCFFVRCSLKFNTISNVFLSLRYRCLSARLLFNYRKKETYHSFFFFLVDFLSQMRFNLKPIA